jgi:predicted membrane protein
MMQIQVVVILLSSEGNHRNKVLYCFHIYIAKRPKELLQSICCLLLWRMSCLLCYVICAVRFTVVVICAVRSTVAVICVVRSTVAVICAVRSTVAVICAVRSTVAVIDHLAVVSAR